MNCGNEGRRPQAPVCRNDPALLREWRSRTGSLPRNGPSGLFLVAKNPAPETAAPPHEKGALRPLIPRVQVLVLHRGKGVDRDTERLQLEARDLLVDLGRDDVDLLLELRAVLDH